MGEWWENLMGQKEDKPEGSSLLEYGQTPQQTPGTSNNLWRSLSNIRQIDPENMSLMDWGIGGKDKDGNTIGSGFSSLFDIGKTGLNVWLGLKQMGLSEDNLDFQKNAFSKQFANSASLINSQLRERQSAKVSRDPNHYQPVDEYMAKNAVNTTA